jgi:isoquinoline 1-oxidoreductase
VKRDKGRAGKMKKNKSIRHSNSAFLMTRRNFLKVTGSGIVVFFTVGDMDLLAAQRGFGPDYPTDFNAYLKIDENGRVTCLSGKIEMGQGIITSLAQMLAEELDVPLESVDMVMGDTALCPYDTVTAGSRSTKYFGPPLRKAAAEARAVLIELAAEKLNVDQSRLFTEDGIIKDRENPVTQIPYGRLAKGKRIERKLKRGVEIKHHSKHKISGKAVLRTDSREKVTGEAKFAGDIDLPGMVYAKILRPPAHDARLKSVDVSEVKKVKDIIIVEEKDLIAVLHEDPEEAEKTLNMIKAVYEIPDSVVDHGNIFEHLERSAPASSIFAQKGDIDKGKKQAKISFESKFMNHYVSHAPIETHTAVASVEKDGARLWASTQAPFMVRDSIAKLLELPSEKVRVFPVFVGGGFGGKSRSQQATEAARLSQLTSKPVQVAWTRKEEFFYDTFRPAAIIKAKSGLDDSGLINYWDFEIIFAGSRSSEPIYDIPHYRVSERGGWMGRGETPHPFNTGPWRGPGSNTNVFAMESQIDIMAQAAGIDPLSFRLNNLTDKRMEKVLNAAADKFGRSFKEGPSGDGVGIACTDYLGTYVATIAMVKVDKEKGNVRVERIVCAQDMGEIINPQGARIQIEGGIIMALSASLSEKVRFNGGTVLTENFNTYDITPFSWIPQIDVVLVDNPEMAPQGCGEPATTSVGAVIANAVYDATGCRLYELPMTPDLIRSSLVNT